MSDISKASLPKAIFLMGPTASGKTALAIELRKILPVELISVDSALIYKGMDIGTAKPNAEELLAAPHRLLDIRDPSQAYSAADFRRDALAARIHPNDPQRLSRALEVFFISGKTLTELTQTSGDALPYQVHQFAIAPASRELLHQRIEQRFHQMLASGFEAEVRALFARGDLHTDLPSIRCVGYRQMWSYLEGEISYDEMVYRGVCATRQLAKRQITWLRGWEGVHWLDSEKPEQARDEVLQVVGAIAG